MRIPQKEGVAKNLRRKRKVWREFPKRKVLPKTCAEKGSFWWGFPNVAHPPLNKTRVLAHCIHSTPVFSIPYMTHAMNSNCQPSAAARVKSRSGTRASNSHQYMVRVHWDARVLEQLGVPSSGEFAYQLRRKVNVDLVSLMGVWFLRNAPVHEFASRYRPVYEFTFRKSDSTHSSIASKLMDILSDFLAEFDYIEPPTSSSASSSSSRPRRGCASKRAPTRPSIEFELLQQTSRGQYSQLCKEFVEYQTRDERRLAVLMSNVALVPLFPPPTCTTAVPTLQQSDEEDEASISSHDDDDDIDTSPTVVMDDDDDDEEDIESAPAVDATELQPTNADSHDSDDSVQVFSPEQVAIATHYYSPLCEEGNADIDGDDDQHEIHLSVIQDGVPMLLPALPVEAPTSGALPDIAVAPAALKLVTIPVPKVVVSDDDEEDDGEDMHVASSPEPIPLSLSTPSTATIVIDAPTPDNTTAAAATVSDKGIEDELLNALVDTIDRLPTTQVHHQQPAQPTQPTEPNYAPYPQAYVDPYAVQQYFTASPHPSYTQSSPALSYQPSFAPHYSSLLSSYRPSQPAPQVDSSSSSSYYAPQQQSYCQPPTTQATCYQGYAPSVQQVYPDHPAPPPGFDFFREFKRMQACAQRY